MDDSTIRKLREFWPEVNSLRLESEVYFDFSFNGEKIMKTEFFKIGLSKHAMPTYRNIDVELESVCVQNDHEKKFLTLTELRAGITNQPTYIEGLGFLIVKRCKLPEAPDA